MKHIPYGDTIIQVFGVKFMYSNEKTLQSGVYIHDCSDLFRDGDTIYGNGWTIDMINDAGDLESLFSSDDGTTYFHQTVFDGIYRIY